VESSENKVLHYTVSSASLKTYLYDHFQEMMIVFDP
jgi:hypothetical protein